MQECFEKRVLDNLVDLRRVSQIVIGDASGTTLLPIDDLAKSLRGADTLPGSEQLLDLAFRWPRVGPLGPVLRWVSLSCVEALS